MTGRVIKSTGNWYEVLLNNNTTVSCRLKGKQRLIKRRTTNPVVIGDMVHIEKSEHEDGLLIDEILPRHNYIIRQSTRNRTAEHILAANLDLAVLVATFIQPKTSTGFIDRFLCTAAGYHIPAMLVFNKMDLLDSELKKHVDEIKTAYEKIGYPVLEMCALHQQEVDPLQHILQQKISLISGHSGVGKSTLINNLIPGLNQKTNVVSGFHEKGQHTTTFTEMFPLPDGGFIIDMPGIKEFGILDFEPEEVSHFFPEMNALLDQCRFNNCLHINEPNCKVKAEIANGNIPVWRYQNYLSIIHELMTDDKIYNSDK